MVNAFHPDLAAARFLPPLSMGRRVTAIRNHLPPRTRRVPPDIEVRDLEVPGATASTVVRVRTYRPRSLRHAAPVLLWSHSGGMVIGSHLQDEPRNIAFARTLGIMVVSVDYRLAPANPAPAALEDVYAVLKWLITSAAALNIDSRRVALGGASAGGGLSAGVALLARDRGEVTPAFQLLVYPMLDDRTATQGAQSAGRHKVWTAKSNRFAWTAYLGREPGGIDVSPYAAPARATSLTGLPPAWVGVGTLDLFHNEVIEYAQRLRDAGIRCQLDVVPGAFNGFDMYMRSKPVSRRFWEAQVQALELALIRSE